jgi:YD repeat-containing protein
MAMGEYYEYGAMNTFFKLEANDRGRAFRFTNVDGDVRYEFYKFGERTAKFINDGQLTGQVVRVSKERYMEKLEEFLAWVEKALVGLRG